jgi:hypothetical protein
VPKSCMALSPRIADGKERGKEKEAIRVRRGRVSVVCVERRPPVKMLQFEGTRRTETNNEKSASNSKRFHLA